MSLCHNTSCLLLLVAQSFLVAKGTAREDGLLDDPPLAEFEAQIVKYRGVQEEVQVWPAACQMKAASWLTMRGLHPEYLRGCKQGLPATATIGYLKIDARPVKQALLAWVTKWIFLFTTHLESKVRLTATAGCVDCSPCWLTKSMPLPQVVGTMKELYSFMAGSSATLDVFVNNEVPDGAHTAEACPCQL